MSVRLFFLMCTLYANSDVMFISASITQPQNGMDGHVMTKIESQHYYYNSCEPMGPVTPMTSHMQNGEPSNLSPHSRPSKKRRTAMGSMSSAEEEGAEAGEEGENSGVPPHSYTSYGAAKSPNSLSSPGSWQGDPPPPLDNDALRSDSSYRGNWFEVIPSWRGYGVFPPGEGSW